MNKLSAKLAMFIIKLVFVLVSSMFSVLCIVFAGIHVGSAMAFLAIVGTVLVLDSLK